MNELKEDNKDLKNDKQPMTLRVMNTRPVQKGRNMYRYHNDNAAVSNYQYNV